MRRFTILIVTAAALCCTLAFPLSALSECTEDSWDPATSYVRGDLVTWVEHTWRAKRNTTGTVPGTHKPTWADLGACADPPPPGEDPDPPDPPARTPMQIFGVWHAGENYADWSQPVDMVQFAFDNDWLIHGNGGSPAVNLVVLSFLNPLEVLAMHPDDPTSGVPIGMTQDVVDFFANEGIRVMMSIGGVTYVDFWNEALARDATLLGRNAAAIASEFGVGIEIDYEENTAPDLVGLDDFIAAYRGIHPYDASEFAAPEARLTIDLAAGGRYLQDLNRHATIHWLDNANPVLDYANAMVHRASGTPQHWQEHVEGKPTYDPPIPPKAPNRFTGGLYLKGNMSNCTDYLTSEQYEHEEYVHTVPSVDPQESPGMLGYMFWAAGVPSARKNYVPTDAEHSCEGGMGVAAAQFEIPVPMPPLRQE